MLRHGFHIGAAHGGMAGAHGVGPVAGWLAVRVCALSTSGSSSKSAGLLPGGVRRVTPGALQGPALLAWNNATFSPADFAAIAKIGQDTKMSRPASIGRFGLGTRSMAGVLL